MFYIVLALVALGCVSAVIGYFRNRKRGGIDEGPATSGIPEVCCGQHEVCERESLLAAVSRKVEYYDDEELDRFRGVGEEAYPEEAVEEFREVLYTLREEEVAGWLRSLQLRQVNLPAALKDEALMIVGERRK